MVAYPLGLRKLCHPTPAIGSHRNTPIYTSDQTTYPAPAQRRHSSPTHPTPYRTVRSYEQQASIANTRDNKPQEKEEPPISANDSDFLNKAVALVEAHLNSPGYTVEQLSKDLCMERSGLYKKLNTLIDKSPSLFIRSIRLRRAADLIRKGGMNMADIAEQVGFSSASYMSKCFQEEFGCRPSEYAEKEQEST